MKKEMKEKKEITKTSKTETLTSGNNNMGGDHKVWDRVEGRAHSDRHIFQETPGTQFPVISGQHCHWQTAMVKFKHEIAPDQRPNSKHTHSPLFFVLWFLSKFQIVPPWPKITSRRIGCVSLSYIHVPLFETTCGHEAGHSCVRGDLSAHNCHRTLGSRWTR